MWVFVASALVLIPFAVVSFLNRRPIAGSLGVIAAAIPWGVIGIGPLFCSTDDLVCGWGILVTLIYSIPLVLGFGLVAAIGAFRRPVITADDFDPAAG